MFDLKLLKPRGHCDAPLRALLETAIASYASPKNALAALAALDPAAAFEYLLADDGSLTDIASASEISAVISSALAALRGEPAALDKFAARTLRKYSTSIELPAALDLANTISTYEDLEVRAAIDGLLKRFPADPGLLRIAVRVAQKWETAERVDALLTRLGIADPTPATIAFVARSRDPHVLSLGTTPARIAFLSSYTIDTLVPFVDLAARVRGIAPTTYVSPFNSWMRDTIDPNSGLRAFDPDITFLSIAIDDLIPELSGHLDDARRGAAGDAALERLLAAVDGYLAWAANRPLVVHSFHSAFSSVLGILDGRDGRSRVEWLADLNSRLATALRQRPACYLLDVAETASTAGSSFADNAKLRHIAAMRLPPSSLGAIADGYVRFIVPARGLTKKCVVLDLDNTLWGGVVGEVGAEGIRLSVHGPGSEFGEFQAFLRSLADRGILLAINSKNNPDDALEVIRGHASMVLRENSFSAVRINWQSKSDNMIEIARELNIGVDSLVFVDDNPEERERMRQLLPSVLTLEMPRDPTLYRTTLERLPELQTLAITDEDRIRVRQYETARLRETAKSSTGNVEAYLASLEIRTVIEPATPQTYARIAQLFSKTNQFNTTTKRYSLTDVERFVVEPHWHLWTLSSSDRFGDHGLVALALLKSCDDGWEIDSFLMSCRVIGYGIETALLSHVARMARSAGAKRLEADFILTKKNEPARDLYAKLGFSRVQSESPIERWSVALENDILFPPWIELRT